MRRSSFVVCFRTSDSYDLRYGLDNKDSTGMLGPLRRAVRSCRPREADRRREDRFGRVLGEDVRAQVRVAAEAAHALRAAELRLHAALVAQVLQHVLPVAVLLAAALARVRAGLHYRPAPTAPLARQACNQTPQVSTTAWPCHGASVTGTSCVEVPGIHRPSRVVAGRYSPGTGGGMWDSGFRCARRTRRARERLGFLNSSHHFIAGARWLGAPGRGSCAWPCTGSTGTGSQAPCHTPA